MRAIRSLTSFVALLLVASTAAAQSYFTFAGRLTTNRGRNTNVPMAGLAGCGSLTVVTGPIMTNPPGMIVRGVNTQPYKALNAAFNWKSTMNRDQGCVPPGRAALKTTGKGAGVGAGFSLPPLAFTQPYPRVRHPAHYKIKTDIPVVEIKNFPPALQLATSVRITAPPPVRAHYGGTQGTKGGGTAMHAAFRKFKTGAWATHTGRAKPDLSWCPPALTMLSGSGVTNCANFGSGGFRARIKYHGTATGFGGTMSLVTHQVPGVGSIAIGLGAPIAFNNFAGGNSQATGRGYADYKHIVLPSGDIHTNFTVMTRYIGPILGNQKVVGMVGAKHPLGQMWPGGDVYDWGFPWTTMTVVVRAENAAMTRASTFTAKGWDCAGNMEGQACSKTPTMGVPPGAINRNISLVSGAVGIARLPPPFGDSPIANMGNMQLFVMPEPGKTLQLLAGAIGLLGVAAWRWRRVR